MLKRIYGIQIYPDHQYHESPQTAREKFTGEGLGQCFLVAMVAMILRAIGFQAAYMARHCTALIPGEPHLSALVEEVRWYTG